MIEVVEKVEGEVVNKTYGEIVEEIRRKLEKFRIGSYPVYSSFRDNDLVVLIPRKDYEILMNHTVDIFTNDLAMDKIFGVKIEVADVNKIYVAYDEPEGSVYHE